MTTPEYQKITQAINYLAKHCGSAGVLNRMKAIKLLYIADRYHLRKYGRPLAFDIYFAMKNGVVGSLAKDLTEDSDFLDNEVRNYANRYIQRVSEHELKTVGDFDRKVFSETDLEALDFSALNFGQFDQFYLGDFTHVLPEWKKHEKEALVPGNRVSMSYTDFFEDPLQSEPLSNKYAHLLDFFKQGSTETAKEIFQEWNEQAKLWA